MKETLNFLEVMSQERNFYRTHIHTFKYTFSDEYSVHYFLLISFTGIGRRQK